MERAESQLFRTLKNFEIGSLTKKLRTIMYLTLMMENDRLLSLGISKSDHRFLAGVWLYRPKYANFALKLMKIGEE